MGIWKQAKSDSPKLDHKIKTEFGPGQQYLTFVRDLEARKSLIRLRISAHNLFVELGRYETSSNVMNEIVCIPQLILLVRKLKRRASCTCKLPTLL